MNIDLVKLFCSIDDFWLDFEKKWKERLLFQGNRNPPRRRPLLHPSEIMTIVILFHTSGFRNFKTFYTGYVCNHLRQAFPKLPSYQRFVELKKCIPFPLYCYLTTQMGKATGISFVDSTSLAVCHSKRASRNKVFKGIAKRGKTSVGWFFGFKLHLIVNDKGELLSFVLTPGNTDDRKPVPKLVESKIMGLLFGDRGYISADLAKRLRKHGVQLVTRIRSNMKNKLMPLIDKLLLRKRGIIETIIDQLKNISQIEHSRHRSPVNFVVNLFAGLIAYCQQSKKPSLNLHQNDANLLKIC
jgi:Transposase DDE domain